MNKISLVIFDLSDVLIKGLEGVEHALSDELNIHVDDISKNLYAYNYHDFWTGKVTEESCLTQVILLNNWPIKVETFKSLIRKNFYEIKGTREIIKKVSRKYKTVLLSVNPKSWAEYMFNKFELYDLFPDGVYFSYHIGFTKRQKESFEYVLKEQKVEPKDVLLIDDSKRNLSMAETIGISGIRFINALQLEEELQRRKLI